MTKRLENSLLCRGEKSSLSSSGGRSNTWTAIFRSNQPDRRRQRSASEGRWRPDGRPTPRLLARCCCTRASADTIGTLVFFVSYNVRVALAAGKRAMRESMCGATVASTHTESGRRRSLTHRASAWRQLFLASLRAMQRRFSCWYEHPYGLPPTSVGKEWQGRHFHSRVAWLPLAPTWALLAGRNCQRLRLRGELAEAKMPLRCALRGVGLCLPRRSDGVCVGPLFPAESVGVPWLPTIGDQLAKDRREPLLPALRRLPWVRSLPAGIVVRLSA
eukprot:COSAG06_NODE_1340_length_9800_cov_40.231158_3_plen_274_part_00